MNMVSYLKSLVTIYSSDIQRAVDFYGHILGLTETYRFPRQNEPEHVEFQIGGTTIAVSSPAGLVAHGLPPATPGHPFEIGIKTDDLDGAIRELRAKGAAILKEPTDSPAGNRYAYIADPDGNWISLYQNIKS
jgi:lactoylglutathione lyase